MNILVTGGAGYVGSLLVEGFVNDGHKVVAVDNLNGGNIGAVIAGAEVYVISIALDNLMDSIFKLYSFDVVVHTASSVSPSESVDKPDEYFKNNVGGLLSLLDVMRRNKVGKILFSSSSCVYGDLEDEYIKEDGIKCPINPYGESKLMCERILEWYRIAYGLKYIAFRYFNVAGASKRLGPAKPQSNGLIPNALEVVMGKRDYVPVNGIDYDTADGTCIRDFVHIKDIVRAHLMALGTDINGIYNLGSGKGYSVMEVIGKVSSSVGQYIHSEIVSRLQGDATRLVADISKANKDLGWEPVHSDIENIISDTWNWMQVYPEGYRRIVEL